MPSDYSVQTTQKVPFIYYVTTFLGVFFVPSPLPKHISCTENKQKLPFSNPIPPQTSAYGIYEWSPEAISAEGLRGKWTEYMKCQGKTDFITGVRLKSEPWKGWGKPSSQSTNREVKEFLKEHTTYFFYVYVLA